MHFPAAVIVSFYSTLSYTLPFPETVVTEKNEKEGCQKLLIQRAPVQK